MSTLCLWTPHIFFNLHRELGLLLLYHRLMISTRTLLGESSLIKKHYRFLLCLQVGLTSCMQPGQSPSNGWGSSCAVWEAKSRAEMHLSEWIEQRRWKWGGHVSPIPGGNYIPGWGSSCSVLYIFKKKVKSTDEWKSWTSQLDALNLKLIHNIHLAIPAAL